MKSYRGDEYEDTQICASIEYSKTLYLAQKKNVEREKYIENLLLEDYVNTVRRNRSKYDYLDDLMNESQKEVDKKGKKSREHINALTSFLSQDFFNSGEIIVLNMIRGGYENYYWKIDVEFRGEVFALYIPMMDNINIKNFEIANCGQFRLALLVSESQYELLTSSYKIEDIAHFVEEAKKTLSERNNKK